MEKSRAILIRRYRFSETSLIVIWITEHHGKIKTSARGALQPKSPLRGKLDLFFECEIAFERSRSGDLHALRETVLLQPFDQLGTRYANLATAAYFGDLTDLATESSTPAEGTFDLLSRAVNFLRENPATLRAVAHFEASLCRILGIHSTDSNPLHTLASHCGRIPKNRSQALKALATRTRLNSSPRAPLRFPQPRDLLPSGMHGTQPSAGNMTGSLLVAHPTLRDPHFRRTIILLSNHSADEGAIGIVLNRPVQREVGDVADTHDLTNLPLFDGGPVHPDVFLLASLEWDEESDSLVFQTYSDPDAPVDIVSTENQPQLRGFLGYSGWSRGQLEAEIAQSAWLVLPPTPRLIEPGNDENTWRQLMRSISPIHHLLSEMPDDPSLN